MLKSKKSPMYNQTPKAVAVILATKIFFLIISLNIEGAQITYFAEASVEQDIVGTIDEDLCGLDSIVCEEEKPLQKDLTSIPHETQLTANLIKYLHKYSEGKDVDPEIVSRTIYCESMWYNIQSGYVNEAGIREDSWGLAQIHLPSHPSISREEALDPYFSIRFIVDRWHDTVWYGYDREEETCTNSIIGYWE